jgi:Family of unknown function (DUF6353)
MKLNSIKIAVTRGVGRKVLTAKKNSPHIFFALGVVGTVGSAVLACRATLKLSDTLDEVKEEVEKAKESQDGAAVDAQQRDMAFVYAKGSLKLAKLYAPSVVLGTASIVALTGSHIQLSRRNSALIGAYAALQSAYDSYRERVREVLGEEAERDIHNGVTTESVIDGKSSKTVKVMRDPNKPSIYAKWFDESNPNWQKDAEYNLLFLKCQQEWAQNRLHSRGYLFLNEVYKDLGIEPTKAGQFVGWMIGKKNSDNFVDFGIYEVHKSEFINGREPRLLLDFNVDGAIYNEFPEN